MPLDPTSAREYLNAFDFKTLFNEELGWNKPTTREATQFECQDTTFIPAGDRGAQWCRGLRDHCR